MSKKELAKLVLKAPDFISEIVQKFIRQREGYGALKNLKKPTKTD